MGRLEPDVAERVERSSGTVAAARLGSGTAGATTFLRGDNTWATPADTVTNGGIPSGAAIFVTTASCPTGFSEYAAAAGRYLVGLAADGTSGDTVGTALTAAENRATGGHNHGFSGATYSHGFTGTGHDHGFSGESHSHGLSSTSHTNSFSGSDSHTHTVNHQHTHGLGDHTHNVGHGEGTVRVDGGRNHDVHPAGGSEASQGSTASTIGQSVDPIAYDARVSISGTTGSSSAGSRTNGASLGGSVGNASVAISVPPAAAVSVAGRTAPPPTAQWRRPRSAARSPTRPRAARWERRAPAARTRPTCNCSPASDRDRSLRSARPAVGGAGCPGAAGGRRGIEPITGETSRLRAGPLRGYRRDGIRRRCPICAMEPS